MYVMLFQTKHAVGLFNPTTLIKCSKMIQTETRAQVLIFNDLVYLGRLRIRWVSLIFFIPGKVFHGRCYIVLSFSLVNAAFEKRP